MVKGIGRLLALIVLVLASGWTTVEAQAPAQAEVIVTKVVEGTPPPGTEFVIEVRCVIEEDPSNTFTETVTFPEAGGTDSFPVTDEVDCEVEETDTGGADGVAITCQADGLFTDVECNSDTQFEIDGNALEGNASITVTVTDTFDPEPPPVDPPPPDEEPEPAPDVVEAQPTLTG